MQIPGPDTRVVELRVHGILGTTGEGLTDAVAAVDVAGDGVGRVVRPADRLRRPVPGPTLSTGERTVSRVVEGYVWGGMTSGGPAKATWALLFPFALANVAHWMLPPTRQDNFASRTLSAALRGLLRVAALLLTLLFVAQLTVASLDLVAAQCLNAGSGCMEFVPSVVRDFGPLRVSIALLPIALVILLMHYLSSVKWHVSGSTPENPHDSARAPIMPGANVVADPDTPALRTFHIVGALAVVVLLALGGPFAGASDTRWSVAAALLGFALVGTAALDDPTGLLPRSASTAIRRVCGVLPQRVLLAMGAVLFVSIAIAPPAISGQLPGSGPTIDAITTMLMAACVAVAVLLVPAALLARPEWTKLASHLRPWAGGWMAAPVLLIACLLGGGFGAGLAFVLRQTLGAPDLVLPAAYTDVTVFWGATAVLTGVGVVLAIPYVAYRYWRKRTEQDVPAEIALLHAGRQQDQRSAATAWRWASLQRQYLHFVPLMLAVVLGTSAALTIVTRFTGLSMLSWSEELTGLGVTVLVLLAAGLLRMVYVAVKHQDAARYIAILCDLTLFWPREAHPIVPPCYALKVIPELAARAKEHLAEPDTRVVLVGHSQGSLLAAVAVSRLMESLPEKDRERVGLVTAGSQLQWAYPRAFPGVVSHTSLGELAARLDGRWRSLCRGTDPIGGAVTTWNRQVYNGMLIGVGFRADGTEGPLSAAVRGPTGSLVLGGDHWLPDPQRGPFSSRRWLPGVLAHSEYSSDPEWDRAVAMAAGLESPVRGATLPLRTVTTSMPTQQQAMAEQGEQSSLRVPQGGDGANLPSGNGADVEAGEDTSEEADVPARSVETERATSRAVPTELPEIVEPRGRSAPWERAVAVRRTDT